MPEWLRTDVHRSLAWLQRLAGGTNEIAREIPGILARLKSSTLIELGSGSGALLAAIEPNVSSATTLVATDLHPQVAAWSSAFADFDHLRFVDVPVPIDSFAEILHPNASDAILLSAVSHHLVDDELRSFFASAARARVHVIIAEPLDRSAIGIALGASTGLGALLVPIASFADDRARVQRVLTHWAVPIVPFILSHDGIVSALRQRTALEWEAIVSALPFRVERRVLGPFGNVSLSVFVHEDA
ncbi:hypothetical protein BH09MYX1_BH09MYX1_00220 [soil metagenome]